MTTTTKKSIFNSFYRDYAFNYVREHDILLRHLFALKSEIIARYTEVKEENEVITISNDKKHDISLYYRYMFDSMTTEQHTRIDYLSDLINKDYTKYNFFDFYKLPMGTPKNKNNNGVDYFHYRHYDVLSNYLNYNEYAFRVFLQYGEHKAKYSNYLSGEIATILFQQYEKYVTEKSTNNIVTYGLCHSSITRVFAVINKVLNSRNFVRKEYVNTQLITATDIKHTNRNGVTISDKIADARTLMSNGYRKNGELYTKNIQVIEEKKVIAKNFTFDDLLKQWEYRDGRTEQKKVANYSSSDTLLNTINNIPNNDSIELNYEVMEETKKAITNIKNRMTNQQLERFIICLNTSNNTTTDRKFISDIKKRFKLQDLNKNDLLYLFTHY